MKKTMRTEVITVRVTSAIKRALEKAAEKDRRSLSGYVVTLLIANIHPKELT